MAVALPLLLLVLLPVSSRNVLAEADDEHGYTLVEISSLRAKAVCSGHRVPLPQNRTWVPLSLLHGSCSPSWSARAKPPPLAELLRQDQRRVEDIRMRLSGKKIKKRPAHSVSTQMNSGPVANVNFGTSSTSEQIIRPAATSETPQPGVTQTVMLDTASDVPWVQCVQCLNPPCPSYDPALSTTYVAFPCNSTACRRLGAQHANGCINNQCQYRTTSPDGLTSSGTYGSDVLSIGGAGTAATITSFRFGCSHSEQGSMGSQAQAATGIMALGQGVLSLVSQTKNTYGDAFSYCIPPTPSYPGFFTLGAPIAVSTRFVLTPMVVSNDTFHRVLLSAITVAGQRLDVPTEVFAAGAVLDSRTAITRLPLTAYDALRAAFRSNMAAYRATPPKGILDTCFDFGDTPVVNLPKVTLVFDQDAVVELDPSGVLFNDCLAFASNGDDASPGILGSVQQQTIEVLYDVRGGAVGFRRLAC